MFALCECARARTRELLAFHRAHARTTQRLILLFKMLIEPNICFNEQRDSTPACVARLLLLLLLVTHALSLPPPLPPQPSPRTLACDATVDADLWPRRLFRASQPAQQQQQPPQELCIRFGLV